MSRGHCILAHGFESGPDALKVTALAEVAERLGWTHERPDFTDLDARRDLGQLGDVRGRLQRLLEIARAAAEKGPVVLAGSSLGSYIAAQVSLQVPTRAVPDGAADQDGAAAGAGCRCGADLHRACLAR